MIEYLVRGLLNGAVYGLLALPMSLLFATAATIDFSIGAYALLAAAVATSVAGVAGLLAALAAALAASCVMAGIFSLLRQGAEQSIRIALASFGWSAALSSLVLMIWGTQPFVRGGFANVLEWWGLRLSPQSLINLAVSGAFAAGVYLVLRHTSLGRMMRAAASSPRAAELAGIPVALLQSGTIVGGGLLGGVAGLLIVYSAGLDFTASLSLTFTGFAAAILYGMRNPLYSLAGGLTMGAIEALAAGYTSGIVTSMIPPAFVLLILISSQLRAGRFVADRP